MSNPAGAKVAALLLAAGRGERLGADVPKAYVRVAGRTLVEHSLAALEASGVVDEVVPVIGAGDSLRFAELGLPGHATLRDPVVGGAERQDSVAAGVAALRDDVSLVAVHDAARCLVSPDDIARVVARAQECGAAILAEPARDSLKRVVDGRITGSLPRAECWLAQTPQVFRRDWLARALEKAASEGRMGTDDAELVERLGVDVAIVASEAPNPKVTLPGDVAPAEALLQERALRREAEEGA